MPGLRRRLTRRRRMATEHRALDGGLGVGTLTAYLALGLAAGAHEDGWETKTLTVLNAGLGRRPLLRLPQQLGTPWMLPALAAIAFWRHRPHLAAAATLSLPAEKALEVAVKKLVRRRRPAKSPHRTRLLDDAPADGPSYPSGHVAIAFAVTTLLAPYVDLPIVALAATGGLLVALRRVQQGAHFPLDTVGGALLGVGVGSATTFVVGRPALSGTKWTL